MNKVDHFPSISVIVTVLNEVDTIDELMGTLVTQSQTPQAIVITDGGSTDGTWEKLMGWKQKKLPVELIMERVRGNRSMGRNKAVQLADTELIACTDAGCVPEKTWFEELLKEQKRSGVQVVAGYYQGLPQSDFQVAQIPYVLVMPDQVDPTTFLPATRSMLFNRQWLINNGGFDETLADNEDYALARKIRNLQQSSREKILSFTNTAIVGWRPRKTLQEFTWMIYRFARGDARAHLWRPKVALIFLRYLLLFCLLIMQLFFQTKQLSIVIVLAVSVYLLWSIAKNLRYAQSAWYWLPILQVTSDFAVMSGTIAGLAQKCQETKLCDFLEKNESKRRKNRSH